MAYGTATYGGTEYGETTVVSESVTVTGIAAGLYWQYIVHDPAGSRQTWLGEVYIAP